MAQEINPISHIRFLCDFIPPLLRNLDEEQFSFKSAPNKWSKKQILGHLIDSATINHHRFIRGQFEEIPHISYDQDKWNNHGYYQNMASAQLIDFWRLYNLQLAALWEQIPSQNLLRKVNTGTTEHTLAFLIQDYLDHLEHHLKQIVDY